VSNSDVRTGRRLAAARAPTGHRLGPRSLTMGGGPKFLHQSRHRDRGRRGQKRGLSETLPAEGLKDFVPPKTMLTDGHGPILRRDGALTRVRRGWRESAANQLNTCDAIRLRPILFRLFPAEDLDDQRRSWRKMVVWARPGSW